MKVLILMANMECGGVQISLLNFLHELLKYDVDVTILFEGDEGDWWERLPENIKILKMKYTQSGYGNMMVPTRQLSFLQNIIYHIAVHWADLHKDKYRNPRYSFLLKHVESLNEEYDIAIDYHGYGYFTTSYLAEKVKAKKKVFFVHDEKIDCIDNIIGDLNKIDEICCVSKSCKKNIIERFPQVIKKAKFFPNFINTEEIQRKATEKVSIPLSKGFTFVTVGRVMWQKGYELAVSVAKNLKDRGILFSWYCIGDGAMMEEIKSLIREKQVEDCFFMLGQKDNPYPYIKIADIYIQTSRHEGFGLAVAEALILEKIVVSTNIECIAEQLEYGKCGRLAEHNSEDMCNVILDILNDPKKQSEIKYRIKSRKIEPRLYIDRLLYK